MTARNPGSGLWEWKGRVYARQVFGRDEQGRKWIIVTELPYMTNKATLIEKLLKLCAIGSLEGVIPVASDRLGMGIVIELSKTANPDEVLKTLYMTAMQAPFGINILVGQRLATEPEPETGS